MISTSARPTNVLSNEHSQWQHDGSANAFNHIKVIRHMAGALPLMTKAGVVEAGDEGAMAFENTKSSQEFLMPAEICVFGREKQK